jgi:hypothetical protein
LCSESSGDLPLQPPRNHRPGHDNGERYQHPILSWKTEISKIPYQPVAHRSLPRDARLQGSADAKLTRKARTRSEIHKKIFVGHPAGTPIALSPLPSSSHVTPSSWPGTVLPCTPHLPQRRDRALVAAIWSSQEESGPPLMRAALCCAPDYLFLGHRCIVVCDVRFGRGLDLGRPDRPAALRGAAASGGR